MNGYVLGYVIASVAILFFIVLAVIAQVKVSDAYSKYSKVASSVDLSGAEFAQKLASENGINVRTRRCNGTLTDNYDPRIRTLNISAENYDKKSIAAQAVVAHEFGHAMQHASGYIPLKLRQFSIKFSQFVSGAFLPLLLVGILLEIFFVSNVMVGNMIIYLVAGIYGLSFLVNLITLPVEYNASKRAKQILRPMYNDQEMVGVNKVLDAAALTYLASLLVSLAYFARFLFIILGNRR